MENEIYTKEEKTRSIFFFEFLKHFFSRPQQDIFFRNILYVYFIDSTASIFNYFLRAKKTRY